jgi:hypothetical protein
MVAAGCPTILASTFQAAVAVGADLATVLLALATVLRTARRCFATCALLLCNLLATVC